MTRHDLYLKHQPEGLAALIWKQADWRLWFALVAVSMWWAL